MQMYMSVFIYSYYLCICQFRASNTTSSQKLNVDIVSRAKRNCGAFIVQGFVHPHPRLMYKHRFSFKQLRLRLDILMQTKLQEASGAISN